MARLTVNPTRMELLQLRRRLVLARRGHKLLKDKQDELMRRFLAMLEETRRLRIEVETALREAFREYVYASAVTPAHVMDVAFALSPAKLSVETRTTNIMNLRVPEFRAEVSGKVVGYGFAFTSAALDTALEKYHALLPKMIELAQREKQLEMLSAELERTRRRVNALEYVMIPNIEETIRYITLRLSEMERGELTRVMKVKAMMEERRRQLLENRSS